MENNENNNNDNNDSQLLDFLYDRASKDNQMLYSLVEQYSFNAELDKLNNEDLVTNVLNIIDHFPDNKEINRVLMIFMNEGDLNKEERRILEGFYRITLGKEGVDE
jgi:hypothetical protein